MGASWGGGQAGAWAVTQPVWEPGGRDNWGLHYSVELQARAICQVFTKAQILPLLHPCARPTTPAQILKHMSQTLLPLGTHPLGLRLVSLTWTTVVATNVQPGLIHPSIAATVAVYPTVLTTSLPRCWRPYPQCGRLEMGQSCGCSDLGANPA